MSETRVVCIKGRIQLYGARLEHAPDLVYCGRRLDLRRFKSWDLPQSDWANPFSVKDCGSQQAAADAFDEWFAEPEQAWLRARLPELVGRSLACWCRVEDGEPCHCLVIARLVDALPPVDSPVYGECGDNLFGRQSVSRVLAAMAECGEDFAGPRILRDVDTIRPRGEWAGAL